MHAIIALVLAGVAAAAADSLECAVCRNFPVFGKDYCCNNLNDGSQYCCSAEEFYKGGFVNSTVLYVAIGVGAAVLVLLLLCICCCCSCCPCYRRRRQGAVYNSVVLPSNPYYPPQYALQQPSNPYLVHNASAPAYPQS